MRPIAPLPPDFENELEPVRVDPPRELGPDPEPARLGPAPRRPAETYEPRLAPVRDDPSEVWRNLDWAVSLREHEPEPAPTSAPAPVADPAPEPAASRSSRARAVHMPPPTYPRLSVRAGEEGTVLCRIHVRADGDVASVEVVETSGYPRLDRAALEAIAAWRFEPRVEDGRVVPAVILHPVTFVLTPPAG